MRLRTQLKGAILVRVRRGPRSVLWTPAEIGFGNLLYLWLAVHIGQQRGESVFALVTPTSREWLPLLPAAGRLVIERGDVGWSDRRELGMRQQWGIDFRSEDLAGFVSDVVLGSPALESQAEQHVDRDTVVLNVRRGDYYSVPEFRRRYAFDLHSYLDVALTRSRETGGPIGRLHVVSDNISWCRDNLGWLAGECESLTLAEGGRPAVDFATIATAARLILTNSTFSYWAGYVSNQIHGDNHANVVAPWFHARIGDGRAVQLDPRWTVVEDIPGGWQLPPEDEVSGPVTGTS